MIETQERISKVEAALERYIEITAQSQARFEASVAQSQARTDEALNRLSYEMREFKDEMREFKKDANKQWGELAKRLGTLVEDLIAPAIKPALKRYFKCEARTIAQRMERKSADKSESYEVDLIAVCDDIVFIVEEKTTVRRRDIDYSITKSLEFFNFFPEYIGRKLVLIIGTVAFPEDLVVYSTRKGVYAMAYREWDYMDILNFDEVQYRASKS
ncbi:hypothetical protein MCHI_003361 [Candidatus Magnetoovum chiemensis]|nr:hypothetical protein MCHI_003361 [Candidatus Magnetoovum chiemensis]